jgi:hypothetical protein
LSTTTVALLLIALPTSALSIEVGMLTTYRQGDNMIQFRRSWMSAASSGRLQSLSAQLTPPTVPLENPKRIDGFVIAIISPSFVFFSGITNAIVISSPAFIRTKHPPLVAILSNKYYATFLADNRRIVIFIALGSPFSFSSQALLFFTAGFTAQPACFIPGREQRTALATVSYPDRPGVANMTTAAFSALLFMDQFAM